MERLISKEWRKVHVFSISTQDIIYESSFNLNISVPVGNINPVKITFLEK